MFGARSKLGSDSHGAIMQLENLVGTGLVFRFGVDGNLTAGTAFGDSSFADFPDDFFNDDWVIIAMHGEGTGNVPTNITPGMSTRQIVTDFVSTGGVFTTASMGANWALGDSGYLVPVSLLSGFASPGDPISIVKTLATLPTGGLAVTGASSGGLIHLEEISIQKITGGETVAVTGIQVYTTSDTVALNQEIFKANGDSIQQAVDTGLAVGRRYTAKLNHQLASGGIVSVRALGASGAVASYRVTLRGTVIEAGASIAAA
jgi:hypothetical protein